MLHYRLVEKIGEGGMGVVWKAVDTTLDREVAIKILPDAFAKNPERLARFEREAKLLASLNHPNLATVFGVHETDASSGSRRFLAMELIPGEDLAQRLKRGRLSVDDAVGIAHQITEALEAAHARGVVHRDLKPANIRITTDGTVKILDFGLAKAISPSESAIGGEGGPTMTSAGSVAGVLLGTAAYMSPEQARGQDVDERSDIWSFGCVLWECLTGQILFGGKTASDSIGAVLHTDPDWSRLPENTPPRVRRLLQRSLAKDARSRLHHIADARIELDETDPPRPAPGNASRGYKITSVVLAVALLAISAVTLKSFFRPTPGRSGSQIVNPLADARFSKITDFEGAEFDAAISPDGGFVAFVSDRDGPFEIFVGQIEAGEFRKPGLDADEFTLEDARAPVRSVGFNADGTELWLGGGPWSRVRSVPLLGGPIRNFLNEDVVTVAWSPDGERLVYHDRLAGDPVYVADRKGADARLILGSPEGTHQHYPIWSVDGEWIYLSRGRPTTLEMNLWRVRADGRGLEQLTRKRLDVRYPVPIDERTVMYVARDADGAGPWLWALDVETKVSRRASVGLEKYASLAASADGRRLVATVQVSRAGIWSVPIRDEPASDDDVEPFADLQTTRALAPRFGGSSLFYLSSRGSGDGLWRYGQGKVAEIWRGSETALLEPAAVSPDGASVALLLRRDDGWRLNLLTADGAELTTLSTSVDARGSAAWSPDGELIVYSGAQVNVVAPLAGVRPDGVPVELPEIEVFRAGERMRFLPDGSGLVYMQGKGPTQDFWLLDLATLNSRRLTRFDTNATMRTFDITPDGTRIVFDRLSEASDLVLIERKATGDDP